MARLTASAEGVLKIVIIFIFLNLNSTVFTNAVLSGIRWDPDWLCLEIFCFAFQVIHSAYFNTHFFYLVVSGPGLNLIILIEKYFPNIFRLFV